MSLVGYHWFLGQTCQTEHQYSEGKPTLVFVNARVSTTKTAAAIVNEMRNHFVGAMTREDIDVLNFAAKSISTMSSDHAKLREMLSQGVGFHHAGMDAQDRLVVEDVFRRGKLPVLVSTSTLALGVNLPAHLVVVKGTHQLEGGQNREYDESQVLQMIGRAGRPQFDTSATAVIMTSENRREFYQQLISGSKQIESGLLENLAEHLNTEVVLGTITDVSMALAWLKSTYLYIRAIKNPKYYKITNKLDRPELMGEEMLRDEVDRKLRQVASMISLYLYSLVPH